jgi:ParB family transcriptional regulator, chromosome partitioning protein
MNATDLPLDAVEPNPDQPRRRFDAEALDELAASITSVGLLEPIIVRPSAVPGRFTIIAGERRWRASRLAGLTTVPAIVRDDLDDRSAFELSMIENVIRADMTPVEEARGYRTLVEAGLTPEQVAARLGKSLTAVHYRLNLLKLADPILDLVDVGQLGERDGWLLARVSHEGQYRVLRALNAGLLVKPGDLGRMVSAVALEESQSVMFGDDEAPAVPAPTAKATRTLRARLEAAVRELNAAAEAIDEAGVDELTEALALQLKRDAARVQDRLAARRVAASTRQLSIEVAA